MHWACVVGLLLACIAPSSAAPACWTNDSAAMCGDAFHLLDHDVCLGAACSDRNVPLAACQWCWQPWLSSANGSCHPFDICNATSVSGLNCTFGTSQNGCDWEAAGRIAAGIFLEISVLFSSFVLSLLARIFANVSKTVSLFISCAFFLLDSLGVLLGLLYNSTLFLISLLLCVLPLVVFVITFVTRFIRAAWADITLPTASALDLFVFGAMCLLERPPSRLPASRLLYAGN